MTQKEQEKRLADLIGEAERSMWDKAVDGMMGTRDYLARCLLEDGVIVPPCKVGDTIYRCGDPIKNVYEWQVEHIEVYHDEVVFVDDSDNEFTEQDIGKTVFLTREEAEAALKERNKT